MISYFLNQDPLVLEMLVLLLYSDPYHRDRSSILVIFYRVLFELVIFLIHFLLPSLMLYDLIQDSVCKISGEFFFSRALVPFLKICLF